MIINDSTPNDLLFPKNRGRGRIEGFARAPLAAVADTFPSGLLIPRSEWQARIAERKARKSTLRELLLASGITVLNQQQTNYCWCNAPTFSVMALRCIQNQKPVRLSPASVGGPLTRYRNVGGWGRDALQRISDVGIAPQDVWPANAISSKYDTPATWATAGKYRVSKWLECAAGNVDQLVSLLLRGVPCPVGYNWWSHEVCAVDADWIDGAIAIVIANSWDVTWGDQGYGTLQGSRLVPDDTVAPQQAVAA